MKGKGRGCAPWGPPGWSPNRSILLNWQRAFGASSVQSGRVKAMTDGREWDIDALRAAARTDFAARLPLRIEEIERLAGEGQWVEARREIHKLRGSAATWGFAGTGAVAGFPQDLRLRDRGPPV